jgi:hypothetical protein
MMTREATSSRMPCSRTSTMNPARITMASKEWNQEEKYLGDLVRVLGRASNRVGEGQQFEKTSAQGIG